MAKNNTGVYNLHAENMMIIDVAKQIKNYFPELEIDTTETMFQDNRNYKVSSDKARNELGFNPTLTFDNAIIELKELLEKGRVKNTFLKRFSNYLYLKPLLEERGSPLGKEIKMNL